MNKKYRAQRRILADKLKKEQKSKMLQEIKYNYDKVFEYSNLIESFQKCLKGVSWKPSVQKYKFNCINRLYKQHEDIINRKSYEMQFFKQITIKERGKDRKITPIHINDRVIQKVLCDQLLTPLFTPKLIYDNGASLPNKGVSFTRKRVQQYIEKATREYGNDFYVLQFDFKSFFDSIPHETCYKILKRYIRDDELLNLTMQIIKAPTLRKLRSIEDKAEIEQMVQRLNNDELIGICLGSQVSQILALAIPNKLDHYIKDVCRIKYYIRYMDDGIIFAKTKEELHELYKGMCAVVEELGLHFNDKKTHITKIKKGFVFLKIRYRVTDKNRIIKTLTYDGIVRMRRKLKKYKRLVDKGKMTIQDVNSSMQSWISHAKLAKSFKQRKSMLGLYKELFGIKYNK